MHPRNRDRNGGLVSLRIATGADPLGARARSHGSPRSASISVHGPRCDAGRDSRMVREPLVRRNDVPGEPRAPRRRNAASMVRPRHRANNASDIRIFSLVTLWAADPKIVPRLRPRTAAWYDKREPSFSDAIAAVRRIFWSAPSFSMSRHPPDSVKIPIALMERLTEALCYAA